MTASPTCPSTTKTSTSPSPYHLSANALRSAVRSADALLLVTPKYNGTIPATLKNAIDWISRPYPSDAIVDKPVAVIGSAGGRCGSAWAHEDTRETARIAGANVLNNVTLSVLHGATPFADTPAACDDKVATAITAILATLAAATKSH
jgi:NAD(P)H-dependent FMN reductase